MKSGYLLLAGLLFAGCSHTDVRNAETSRPSVYTVNYPLAYFAERLAGDQADVVFPEMEGDPAFWAPTAEQAGEYRKADLILLNGAQYAKWVPNAALPQPRCINTSAGLEEQFIALDGSASHAHGSAAAHAHGELAFTLWLNPELAVHQAGKIFDALSEWADLDKGALAALTADLEKLDADLAAAFQSLENTPLLGSHPVYQYLTARYGLNMESVHWEPDAEPDAGMWRELADILETHHADVMLWEDEPLPQVKQALADKGIKSVVFNPCGNRPDEGDFMSVMQANVQAVRNLK